MKIFISLSASAEYLWNYPKDKKYEGTLVIVPKDTVVKNSAGKTTVKKGVYRHAALVKSLSKFLGSSPLGSVLSGYFQVQVGTKCKTVRGAVSLKDQYTSLKLDKAFVAELVTQKYLVPEAEF